MKSRIQNILDKILNEPVPILDYHQDDSYRSSKFKFYEVLKRTRFQKHGY